MTVIGALSGVSSVGAAALGRGSLGTPVAGGEGEGNFADTLKKALGEVTEMQTRSEDAMGAFLRGEPIEVHEVMAAAEEAGIALEMLIEIRNKLTEAYRTVSQMQA